MSLLFNSGAGIVCFFPAGFPANEEVMFFDFGAVLCWTLVKAFGFSSFGVFISHLQKNTNINNKNVLYTLIIIPVHVCNLLLDLARKHQNRKAHDTQRKHTQTNENYAELHVFLFLKRERACVAGWL